MRRRVVTVNDRMQQGYSYERLRRLGAISTRSSSPICRPKKCSNSAYSVASISPIAGMSFQQAGSRGRSCRPQSAILPELFRGGRQPAAVSLAQERLLFTWTIRVDGSNGIVGITWAVACPRRTPARSGGGRRSGGTSPNSESIASRAIPLPPAPAPSASALGV